jgi:hypothetical protein
MLPIGTLVKIKSNLIGGRYYGALDFASSMCRYMGFETKISGYYCDNTLYRLEGCGTWNWNEDMFDVVSIPFTELHEGDIVQLKCTDDREIEELVGDYFEVYVSDDDNDVLLKPCSATKKDYTRHETYTREGFFSWWIPYDCFNLVKSNYEQHVKAFSVDIFEHHKTYCC